jgi:hypothetical protein
VVVRHIFVQVPVPDPVPVNVAPVIVFPLKSYMNVVSYEVGLLRVHVLPV